MDGEPSADGSATQPYIAIHPTTRVERHQRRGQSIYEVAMMASYFGL